MLIPSAVTIPPELITALTAVLVAVLGGGTIKALLDFSPTRRQVRIDEFKAIDEARKDVIANMQQRLDDAEENITDLREAVKEQTARYHAAMRYLNQVLGLLRREAPHIELPAAPAAIAEDLL
jgi:hypothetical protein